MMMTKLARATAQRSALGIALYILLAGPIAAAPTPMEHAPGLLVPMNAPQIAIVDGRPLILYLNPKNQATLRRQGVDQILIEPHAARGHVTLPVLYADASGVHVFWRVKLKLSVPGLGKPGDKFIYAQSSFDGGKTFTAPQLLSQGGGAFPPNIVDDGKGALYAVWTDERHGPYHVFLNASPNGGKTWQAHDIKIDPLPPGKGGVLDPTMTAHAGQVWVAWSGSTSKLSDDDKNTDAGNVESDGGNKPSAAAAEVSQRAILLRRSSNHGESWTEPVVAARVARQPVTPTLLWSRGKLLLYWFEEDGIYGAMSVDNGVTWSNISGLPVGPVTSINVTVESKSERVLLVYTIQPTGMNHALFATSSADGERFDAPVHLPRKMPHLTTSLFPEIISDKSGDVLVVWQDYRHIRPAVCARLSKDGGRTWQTNDQCLSDISANKSVYFPRVAGDGKGKFFASWVRYADERLQKAEVVLAEINMNALPSSKAKQPSQTRLEQRVKEFWKTREQAQYAKTYDYFDPFFRSQVRREVYIGSQGTVKYYKANIVDIKITESIANVKVKYSLEIPELDLQGMRYAVPKREEETTQEWFWIDGEWYLAFKDMVNQQFFRY